MSVLNIRAKHNIANYDLQLPVDATIKDLSDKILELTGVPISGQKIIFCGKQLPKDLAQPLTEVRSYSDKPRRNIFSSFRRDSELKVATRSWSWVGRTLNSFSVTIKLQNAKK